jgi:hypothetical protein
MMKRMLAASAAALIIASPTLAQKDQKGGKGGDKSRSGQVMKADKGNRGGGHADHANQSNKASFAKADRHGPGRDKVWGDRGDKPKLMADRGPDKARAALGPTRRAPPTSATGSSSKTRSRPIAVRTGSLVSTMMTISGLRRGGTATASGSASPTAARRAWRKSTMDASHRGRKRRSSALRLVVRLD